MKKVRRRMSAQIKGFVILIIIKNAFINHEHVSTYITKLSLEN